MKYKNNILQALAPIYILLAFLAIGKIAEVLYIGVWWVYIVLLPILTLLSIVIGLLLHRRSVFKNIKNPLWKLLRKKSTEDTWNPSSQDAENMKTNTFPSFRVYPMAISNMQSDVFSYFEPDKNSIRIRELSLREALKGKCRCTNIEYHGSLMYIEHLFKNLSVYGDSCFMKLYVTKDVEDEELEDFIDYFTERMPTSCAISLVKNAPGYYECHMTLLCI